MRPSFAVSLLALVIALGGTSYAAVKLTRNSVRSPHIKNGQVKRADIARGAVDSGRIANGTVMAEDLAPGTPAKGERGEPGPAGAKGDAGPAGPKGDPGTVPAEVTVVNRERIPVDARIDEGRFTLAQDFVTQPGTGVACTEIVKPGAGDLLIEKIYVRATTQVIANLFVNAREGDGSGSAANLPIPVDGSGLAFHGVLEPGVTVRDGLDAAVDGELFRDALRPINICARDSVDGAQYSVVVVVNGRALP